MARIEGTKAARSESPGGQEELTVDDQLTEGVQVGERHLLDRS